MLINGIDRISVVKNTGFLSLKWSLLEVGLILVIIVLLLYSVEWLRYTLGYLQKVVKVDLESHSWLSVLHDVSSMCENFI